MKITERKKIVLYFIIYFIFMMAANILTPVGNMDDAVKYWVMSGIKNGLTLYKDINIIVPPMAYLIPSFVLYIFDSLLSIRILNMIVWMVIFLCMHKISEKYECNQITVFGINLLILFLTIINIEFYYDYNMICLMYLLLIMYITLNKEINTKNSLIIGLLCGLMILTKHTIGIIFSIGAIIAIKYYNNEKKIAKNIFQIISVIFLCILAFFIYLLKTNSCYEFINLAFYGSNNFLKNFGVKITSLVIMLAFMALPFSIYKIKKIDMFDKENKTILIFSIASLAIIIPIVDFCHFKIFMFVYMFLFIRAKINLDKKGVLIIIASYILIFGIFGYTDISVCEFSKYSTYKGLFIDNDCINKIDNLEKIVDYANIENLYIIDKYAIIYENALDRNMGYYDFLLVGNTGREMPRELVRKIIDDKDGYFVIRNDEFKSAQWDYAIIKYIQENLIYVKSEDVWDLYKF